MIQKSKRLASEQEKSKNINSTNPIKNSKSFEKDRIDLDVQ